MNSSLMCSIKKGVFEGDSKVSRREESGMLQTVSKDEGDDLRLIWVQ